MVYQYQDYESINWVVDDYSIKPKKTCYTSEMKGSYSIKKVLLALVPELSYADLNINQGGDASMAFERLYQEKDKTKTGQVRKDLLEYCKLDTLAMVEILKVLNNL